jgi:hypothetical protein
MNDKNLIPANKLSQEEARELGKKGGLKSGIVRKQKKDLKERMKIGLELWKKDLVSEARKSGDKVKANQIDEMGAEVFKILEIIHTSTKDEVKLKALAELMDRTEGKPMQNISAAIGPMADVDVPRQEENTRKGKEEWLKDIRKE